MKVFKKILLFLICFLVILSQMQVFSFEYPNSFWGANKNYRNAIAENDHKKIIEYANELIDIASSVPDSEKKRDDLVVWQDKIVNSYVALKDYDNALKACKTLCDFAGKDGDKYEEYLKIAEARILQYTPEIQLYTNGGKSPYYGSANEKENGVLFGICADGKTRYKIGNESMVLTYQELGQSLLPYNVGVMKNADAEGQAVEFALNCPKQGKDIKNIRNMNSYLKEISELFKQYPDVPVYLRFAAEFDIWDNLAEPEDFKEAFRYVYQYFKTRNENVAIVWSPNQISSWNVNVDDYYPGDKYVDWVGVSLYAKKYFLRNPDHKEVDEVIFKTGINSNPVLAIRWLVEKYGNRKPIMISESGCGHKLVKSREDTSEFAIKRLREYYSYLPMVYPQIKLIAYFDRYVESDSEKEDFRLSTNKKLQKEYLKLTKSKRFIQNTYKSNIDFCYKPIKDGTGVESVFEVSCYAHLYDANLKQVTYFIDGEYEGMSSEIPYTTMIDASIYTGKHRLKAIALFDNGKTLTTEYDIRIDNAFKYITVEVNEEEVYFDQRPIIYNNRTMVPMRRIFEELGATVAWDAETKTVTGRKDNTKVEVTVGQNVMYVNNKAVDLDTAPFIISGRTFVPARAIAEGLGCDVKWYSEFSLVSITSK